MLWEGKDSGLEKGHITSMKKGIQKGNGAKGHYKGRKASGELMGAPLCEVDPGNQALRAPGGPGQWW